MSRLVLEKELGLIRQRLQAIEDALGEEMTAEEKAALEEALKENRKGKSILLKPRAQRPQTLKVFLSRKAAQALEETAPAGASDPFGPDSLDLSEVRVI